MLTSKTKYAVKVDLLGDGTSKVCVTSSPPKPASNDAQLVLPEVILFDSAADAEPMAEVWGPTAEIVEYEE